MGANAAQPLPQDMGSALEGAELEIVFQPIYLFAPRRLFRYEALARWTHPAKGVMAPGAFLAAFEAQGRLGDLTRYMLDRTFADARAVLPLDEGAVPPLSVNLSVTDLMDGTLPKTVSAAIERANFPAASLTLECPQAVPAITWRQQRDALERLGATGCPLSFEARGRIAAVDEGLAPFPYAEIKTGAAGLLRAVRSARAGTGLSAVSDLIGFSQANGIRTVAVGVEDEDAAEAIRGLGFDAGQGDGLGPSAKLKTAPLAPVAIVAEASVKEPGFKTDEARQEAVRRSTLRRLPVSGTSKAPPPVVAADEGCATKDARVLQETLADRVAEGTPADEIASAPSADLPPSNQNRAKLGPEQLLEELPPEPRDVVAVTEPICVEWPMTDFLSPEDELDAVVATLSPAIGEDEDADLDSVLGPTMGHAARSLTAKRRRLSAPAPLVLRVLQRKYRITHFWPRSFKRVIVRQKASRQERSVA